MVALRCFLNKLTSAVRLDVTNGYAPQSDWSPCSEQDRLRRLVFGLVRTLLATIALVVSLWAAASGKL